MPRETRADYTIRELRGYIKQGRRSLDTLEKHVDEIEEDGIKKLRDAKCAWSRVQALEMLEKFTNAVREAHLSMRGV